MEAELAWGIVGALTGSLVTLFIAFMQAGRNGKPTKNPPDPEAARTGDMSVAYWMREFDRLNDQYDRIHDLLEHRLGRIEGLLREIKA